MSTPAINETTSTPYMYQLCYGYGMGTQTCNPPQVQVSGGTHQERPASVENPVLPDGTRRMSPWEHKWYRVYNPVGRLVLHDTRSGDWAYRAEPYSGPSFHAGQLNAVCPFYGGYFPPSVENMARIRFLKKIRSNDFSLGVSLGEARETSRMVGESVRRMAGDIRFFRRDHKLDPRTFKEFLQLNTASPRTTWRQIFRNAVKKNTVVNAWLEMNYGWLPLVRDIHAASTALDTLVNEKEYPMSASFKAGAQGVEIITLKDSTIFPNINWPERDFEVTSACHYSGRVELPVGTLQTLSTLGLDNPLEIAWELVRLSFVVDWVIGVGDWLGTLAVPIERNLYTNVEVSRSRIQRAVPASDWRFVASNSPRWVVVEQPKGNGMWEVGRFSRTVEYQLPFPMYPPLKNKLGLYHLATGLSLLTQMVR